VARPLLDLAVRALSTCAFRVPMSTDGSWHGPS